MFQFLCLYGPGVLAWVTEELYAKKEEEEKGKGILLAVAEMIAYSLADMAVVTTVCRPLGRVQFVTAPDGTFAVQYGASALLLAVFVSVVLGIGMARFGKRSGGPAPTGGKAD